MRTMMASALVRWICSRASECATTAMSAATPHSIGLSARGAACPGPARTPQATRGATTGLRGVPTKKEAPGSPAAVVRPAYWPAPALPVPLVEGLVAESLEGAVRGAASPGPAVEPVLPRAAGRSEEQ